MTPLHGLTNVLGVRPTYSCPVVCDVLCDDASYGRVCDAVYRREADLVVLGVDPGVQSGYALVMRIRGCPLPISIMAWVLGRRAETTRGTKEPVRPPTVRDHLTMLHNVMNWCDEEMPQPVVVCEDWFAGVNPNTARDVAQQYYRVESAAEIAGLTFRAVHNGTWKKTYLGRGNMKSADALAAYTAKGFAAHPNVTRWSGTSPKMADDAAALGIAHHWIATEET